MHHNKNDKLYIFGILWSVFASVVIEEDAIALLPISEEYQIDKLKKVCIAELMKLSKPRLEYVAIAMQYQADNLKQAAMASCANKLRLGDIIKQRHRTQNQLITDDVIAEIAK